MSTLRTACPLDCPDTCTLEVEVGGEAGPEATMEEGVGPPGERLLRVGAPRRHAEGGGGRGRGGGGGDGRGGGGGGGGGDGEPVGPPVNDFTQGFICAKVKRHAERVHGPLRVRTPLVREGPKGAGSFRPVSWDEALDRVAGAVDDAISRHGPEAVAPYLYNSSAGELANVLTPRLFRSLGASRVDATICAATTSAAYDLVYGRMQSSGPEAVDDADLIVLWGVNPAVSGTHLLPPLDRARRRGAELVVVDPRRTGTARRATRWLAPRPGTDVVVALAVAAELERRGGLDEAFLDEHAAGVETYLRAAREWPLERAEATSGVPAGDLAWLAGRLASAGSALFRPGWGLERNRNGGAGYRAVLALPALAGQFGRPGAGVMVSLDGGTHPDPAALDRHVFGPDRPPRWGRALAMHRIGSFLTDPRLEPPVTVLVVQGANPAVTAPNQCLVLEGLAREDLFTVVHDQVLTDTARLADVVLPATTHFEADDLAASYGTFTLQRMRPVIGRQGESRTNDEVAAGLAARLARHLPPGRSAAGFDPDPETLIDLLVPGGVPTDARIRPAGATVQFRETFPTDRGGRRPIFLLDADGHPPAYRPDRGPDGGGFPLQLLSPASPRSINSMLAELDEQDHGIHIHPDDGAARGIGDGRAVVVWNDQARVETVAHLDADMRPGVAWMSKGAWRRNADGLTANALVPDTVNDLADGACFNDARVDVASIPRTP